MKGLSDGKLIHFSVFLNNDELYDLSNLLASRQTVCPSAGEDTLSSGLN